MLETGQSWDKQPRFNRSTLSLTLQKWIYTWLNVGLCRCCVTDGRSRGAESIIRRRSVDAFEYQESHRWKQPRRRWTQNQKFIVRQSELKNCVTFLRPRVRQTLGLNFVFRTRISFEIAFAQSFSCIFTMLYALYSVAAREVEGTMKSPFYFAWT